MRVDYYINAHEVVTFDKVHMHPKTFLQLSGLLEERGLLHSTQHMSINAQLFIFLVIVATTYTIRDLADQWQHSNETMSRCFKNVLETICAFKDQFIHPPDYDEVQQLLRINPHKYLP